MISNEKVIKMFLIEDTSPLGTVVYDEKPQPVILAMSKEFLTLVKSSSNIDYVLACSNYNSHNYVWLISQKYIDDYIVHSIDYASMNFADFTPHVQSK
ncbi:MULTISPECIES: hypothetical protein [unclassified Sedimentibacter]|uniref:hypothetical protein n=1 Tax=unclassified Sedimentibacter TaxID=2649220 RepID=UPI0027DF0479|nr:hypothetical protein [Sedimentibacter sp. MB35-C1]WMJ77132.1 hypothetical protein RBQ61_16395 [Sedimentibacter sp. MB35-C1]